MTPEEIKYLVVHCSATPPQMDIGAAEIRSWHKSKGWNDIGYHAVIRRSGIIEPGRPWSQPGAHVYGYNDCSLGVCLVGGCDHNLLPEDNFTPEQFEALRNHLNMWLAGHPGADIRGHRDFPGVTKACPSFDVRTWWAGGREE